MKKKVLLYGHLALAIAWGVLGAPGAWYITYKMDPRDAAFAILIVSLYANVIAHLAAYGAARAEAFADPNAENPK